jgi:hypothetical protein
MSSAILEILDKDLNVIGYGEFNGTSDTVPPEFVTSFDEIDGQKPYFLGWGDDKFSCNHVPQDITLFSNYGGGFYWPSQVCMKCKMIIGILSPYEPDYGFLPVSENEKKFWEKFRAEGWPKDGDPRLRPVIVGVGR